MTITLRHGRRLLLLTLLSLLSLNATAEYFVVPEDDELIFSSRAIVIATVGEMSSEFVDGRIVTHIDLEIEQVLKGDLRPEDRIRMTEPGGVVGSQIMVVSASPTYWTGNRAMIFLTRTPEGWWQTHGAPLGKFDFVEDEGGRRLVARWATGEHPRTWNREGQPHEEKLRDASKFVAFIERAVAANVRPFVATHPGDRRSESAEADYFVEHDPGAEITTPAGWGLVTNGTFPPSAYTKGTFRWEDFDDGATVTFRVNGSQPGYDSTGGAQRALAAWTNDPGSNVRYVYGGTTTAGFVSDSQNTIVYNSATGVPAGAIAYAQWFGGRTHTYKGETFYDITEGDVVVKSGLAVSQKVFEEAVTHELGHTLGFRHSDQGTPNSTAAIMSSVVRGNYGTTLQSWDIDAVRTVYEDTGTPDVPAAPTGLVARATSTSSVLITWNAVSGATYRLYRSINNSTFSLLDSPSGNSHTDDTVEAGRTYVYRVQAVASGLSSPDSNRDHATTIIFVDDPLVPRVDEIRAVHLTQLRQAVNAVRIAAGLPTTTFTDSNPSGVEVKALHINQLRTALTPALTALGKTATYTDPALTPGTVIKAVHFQELRNLVK